MLAAAKDLLGSGTSFAELSVRQVALHAGLSRQTFYAQFADKRALILWLGDDIEKAVVRAAEPWLTQGTGDLTTTLRRVLRVLQEHRAVALALAEAAAYDPEVRALCDGCRDRFVCAAAQRLTASRRVADADRAHTRSLALVTMTEGTLLRHTNHPAVTEDSLLSELADFWKYGLGTAQR